MADEMQIQDGGEQVQAPVDSQVNADNSVVSTPETPAAAPTEKMIPSSQVSKIAAREARAAAEKAAERARAETRAEIERERAEQQGTSSLGGMPQMDEGEFERRVYQAAHKMSLQSQAQRIESEFLAKIDAEKHSDPEFADLYDALNIEANPRLVLWANSLDNTGSVIKDLAQNPAKYSNILMLMNSGSPKLAQSELKSLSSSIKANEEAKKQPVVAPPLSQMKPSNIGTDNGEMGVSDFRKQPWLRG